MSFPHEDEYLIAGERILRNAKKSSWELGLTAIMRIIDHAFRVFEKGTKINLIGINAHVEIAISSERQRISAVPPDFFNYAWIMSHFYL
jgi:hypothetical protein